ncbi:hypothetical protein [Paracoccus fistulariae]|uniref:Uncharacterized protein n=1 Tax=Paracoccus fistulariae TaxID=658446 RepID=A0ABY7SHG0_9RHOB|nr:hypothetical protein [Paracoccus fistulariae]MDB6181706.1 hypothetical protein [Paracoccus fistulariae]WCR05993.1 hypothetical protein JHX87_10740 [Paracoccus fistulariae]
MKDGQDRETGTVTSGEFNVAAKPRIEIDLEKYQAYFDGSGLTPTQKEDFLRALWSVITAFVDLGFGVHPIQQACGQVENSPDLALQADSDGVSSPDTDLTTTFNDATDGG